MPDPRIITTPQLIRDISTLLEQGWTAADVAASYSPPLDYVEDYDAVRVPHYWRCSDGDVDLEIVAETAQAAADEWARGHQGYDGRTRTLELQLNVTPIALYRDDDGVDEMPMFEEGVDLHLAYHPEPPPCADDVDVLEEVEISTSGWTAGPPGHHWTQKDVRHNPHGGVSVTYQCRHCGLYERHYGIPGRSVSEPERRIVEFFRDED